MGDRSAFRYWGFLSYSHADEAAATRLHRALEHYTLPRAVRRAHALPRRLVPVFRDVEELEAAPGLTARLQAALDDSRRLIVLCSPAAAQSRYVNEEIEYFLRRHGPDKVLCVLLEGDPPACFPPAIRALRDEPLAADLRPGRDPDVARLRLIAAMAAVGFTDLRNREAHRRRGQRLLAAATVAGIAAGGLLYWDLFHREHVDHYAGYVRVHGAWVGVDAVADAVAARRNESYRITRRGRLNPPLRVDFVNGHGGCGGEGIVNVLEERAMAAPDVLQPTARFCAAVFTYDTAGGIRQETLLNELGAVRQALTYTAEDLAQFTRQGFDSPSDRTGVRYVQFVRDASGLDTEVRFLQARGVARSNQAGAHGYRFEYAGGRRMARSVLDAEGRPTGETQRYRYSDQGFLVEIRNEDAAQKPAPGHEGWALARFEHDPAGNVLREAYFDAGGQPTVTSRGFASLTHDRDEHGNVIRTCHFDRDGKRSFTRDDPACVAMRYDASGRRVRSDAQGPDGEPFAMLGTSTGLAIAYDDLGNVIEVRFLDAAGRPAKTSYGSSIERYHHDARGNVLGSDFLDGDGKPAVTPYGSYLRSVFDERDNILEFLFLDENERPFVRPDYGVARMRLTRDERGNVVRVEHADADLKPTLRKPGGFAAVEYRRDALGNPVESVFYDVHGRVARATEGVAIWQRRYDRYGRATEVRFFDEQRRPVAHRDGHFGQRHEYDTRGAETLRVYIDAAGAVMTVPRHGFAGIRFTYDALGRLLQEDYLGRDLEPVASGGLARMRYWRNALGQETARRTFDRNGRPLLHPVTGCAAVITEYNALTLPVVETCLDTGDRPANRKDHGWARKETHYEQARFVEERYFDTAGRAVKPGT